MDALLARAERVMAEAEAARYAREEVGKRKAELEHEVVALRERHVASARAQEDWSSRWSEALHPLGLEATAGVEEVRVVIERMDELFRTRDALAAERSWLAAAEARGQVFAAQFAAISDRYDQASAARDASLDARVDELIDQHRAAVERQRERDEAASALEKLRDEHHKATARRDRAQSAIATCLRLAQVGGIEELAQVEGSVAKARELDQKVANLEEALIAMGDGFDLVELERLVEGCTVDRARSRLQDLEEEIAACEEERSSATSELGRTEAGLANHELRSAADDASRLQASLAQVHGITHEYVRLRLAADVLRRHVEEYRGANQDPIIARATELFPRLTLGAYSALNVGYTDDDRPVLQCVRENGEAVDVDVLSDGTLDQLYLSLRVASLERHAENAEPLPFVVDDMLIHFDDARSHAALEVLAELAETTQVLFFTHHQRLLEIAADVLPGGGIGRHDLSALRALTRAQEA